MSRRTLVVTNDFPPRTGGIQSFIYGLVSRQPPDSVVVFAPNWKGASEFDKTQDFEIIRHKGTLVLPEPRIKKRLIEIAKFHRCESVLFGAAAPLGLLAKGMRSESVDRFVAISHGHEAGLSHVPGSRAMLRRIGETTDAITYLGKYTHAKISKALTPEAANRMRQLQPGVDDERFHPRNHQESILLRNRLGLVDRPVAVCVSRLRARKGQDTLIAALPLIQKSVPDAALLLVGSGPHLRKLRSQVDNARMGRDVVFTGEVSESDLPAYFAAGDVFAMPSRTRARGVDVEGLGIVYLEASATGVPVVAGDSGGAPEAVIPGETGFVVPGASVHAVSDAVSELLSDSELALRYGSAGRQWIQREWSWSRASNRLSDLLQGRDPDVVVPNLDRRPL